MGEHPTNDPTNPLHRLARDLADGVQYPKGVAPDVDYALDRIAELEAKLATAVGALAFFKIVRDRFWADEGSEFDGSDFQDHAERLGLIVKVPFDPERHSDQGYGLEAGDDWFETARDVAAFLRTIQERP